MAGLIENDVAVLQDVHEVIVLQELTEEIQPQDGGFSVLEQTLKLFQRASSLVVPYRTLDVADQLLTVIDFIEQGRMTSPANSPRLCATRWPQFSAADPL